MEGCIKGKRKEGKKAILKFYPRLSLLDTLAGRVQYIHLLLQKMMLQASLNVLLCSTLPMSHVTNVP